MITRRPLDEARLRELVAAHRLSPLSYADEGMTRAGAPRGFVRDHRRVRIGTGPDGFARARDALGAWRQFDLGWVRLVPSDARPDRGLVVAVLARVGPLHVVNLCRVLEVADEPRRYSVTYGTLDLHAERGEERFLVESDAAGGVWYDLLAMSRPRHPLAWAAYPLSRALQRRFSRDSAAAMMRAVAPQSPPGDFP